MMTQKTCRPHFVISSKTSLKLFSHFYLPTREGAGTFREYLILGWGGVVGGVSDPQNCKIQKVPRVLFEKS